jgi:glycosyltransferase involved in cell wall biosynthesis
MGMDSALILSFVEWAGAFQRPQHQAVEFSWKNLSVTYLCAGYLHRRHQQVSPGVDLPENISIYQALALPGASRSPWVEKLNRFIMRRTAVRLKKTPWDLVVFNDPRLARVARCIEAGKRIYDCMDDLSLSTSNSSSLEQAEKEAIETADRIWTGTASLADRLQDRHPHVRFIPCGVDAKLFANPGEQEMASVLCELPPGDGPLAGYFGVINERFNMRLVEGLLESPREWRVLLIGPASSRAPAIPDHPRLRMLGPRPYSRLPAYLGHFDAGLIPYDNQGAHRFLYPVKALEYLAGGVPVLTTSLPDIVRFLSEYVQLADTPDSWKEQAELICDRRDEVLARARKGSQYAAIRSWQTMAEEMLQDLRDIDQP